MKKIKELSKAELERAFTHQFQDVCFFDGQFECAVCGETEKALFYYICDECGISLGEPGSECPNCNRGKEL